MDLTGGNNSDQINQYREKAAEFVWEYTNHSRRIYTYIYSLVFSRSDADDIYQEVGILLWEKFGQFESGSNFGAWACKIAWFKVLDYRRDKKQIPAILGDAVLKELDSKFEVSYKKADAERDALESCLEKLRKKDRHLIIERYQENGLPAQLAAKLEQPVERIYASLKRIRQLLLECITRTLSRQEAL